MHGASLQPSPREPAYDQATYKPPALYPNKKSRIEAIIDRQPDDRSLSDQASRTLPSIRHASDVPRSYGSPGELSAPLGDRTLPVYPSRRPDDVLGNHAFTDSPRGPYQREAKDRKYNDKVDSPIRNDAWGHSAAAYSSSTYAQRRPESNDLRRPNEYPSAEYSNGPSSLSRRSSIDQQHGHLYPLPSPGYGASPQVQPHAQSEDERRYDAEREYRERQIQAPAQQTGYRTPPYGYAQPSYFVSAHYEYANGKPRKRSNLPKESTEIMRKWFEENMTNPYPSEEQKRHFAQMANINLTQVTFSSNWGLLDGI